MNKTYIVRLTAEGAGRCVGWSNGSWLNALGGG
jgi:hypothetical protein